MCALYAPVFNFSPGLTREFYHSPTSKTNHVQLQSQLEATADAGCQWVTVVGDVIIVDSAGAETNQIARNILLVGAEEAEHVARAL